MAATLAAIEIPEPITKHGILHIFRAILIAHSSS